MPAIIAGSSGNSGTPMLENVKPYQYIEGLDLSPDGKIHHKIVSKISSMAEDSYRVMSQRHKKWKDIDDTLKVYIELDEYEKKLKAIDKRRPTSIVVPYSYATIETIMAYLTKAFLTGEVFQYEGYGPEDTIPAKLLELVVNQQVRRFKSELEMHIAMRDSLSYGLGVSTINWQEVWGKKPVVKEIPNYSMFGNVISTSKVRSNEEAMLFEGNEIISIDPYKFLPDPNCSIHNIQNGVFVGWIEFQPLYKLMEDEASGIYTNVNYLRSSRYANHTSKYTTDNSNRMSKKDPSINNTSGQYSYVTLIHMYVKIIPKDWGLKGSSSNGKGDMPEIFLFTIANESIVLRAAPLNLNHNKFPVAVAAPDFDGYSITPVSRMELIDGLQTTLNWMFNSHITNVRKAINDMLIVDPSLVNMEDMENPNPGKLIRLRRSAWGKGVDAAVKQLVVNDITKANMQDAQQIMEMMQRGSAASDAVMGVQRNSSERVTAQEYSGTLQQAVSRLDHIARMISKQYLMDMALFHASHTQQLMTQEVYQRIVGDWPDVLLEEFSQKFDTKKPLLISPFDLIADYDIIFKDGTTQTATSLENDFWTRNFGAILSSDKLGMFNVGNIFKHMARINGAKNIRDFIQEGGMLGAMVQSDQSVVEGAQAGNLVPIDEAAAAMPGFEGMGGDEPF